MLAAAREGCAEFIPASLPGVVLIGRVGDGIREPTGGKLIHARRKLRGMPAPIVSDLHAELVKLLDALAVRAKLTLGAG